MGSVVRNNDVRQSISSKMELHFPDDGSRKCVSQINLEVTEEVINKNGGVDVVERKQVNGITILSPRRIYPSVKESSFL